MTESINEDLPQSPEIPPKKIQSFESVMFDEIMDNYTIKDWIIHPTFIISAIIGIIIVIIAGFCALTPVGVTLQQLLPVSITGTLTLISISTAGFVAFGFTNTEDRFILFLNENGIYNSLILLFFEPVIFGIVNIIFAIVVLVIANMFDLTGWIGAVLLGVVTFLFLYAVLGFLNLYKIFWMFGKEQLNYKRSFSEEITKNDTILTETHDE